MESVVSNQLTVIDIWILILQDDMIAYYSTLLEIRLFH